MHWITGIIFGSLRHDHPLAGPIRHPISLYRFRILHLELPLHNSARPTLNVSTSNMIITPIGCNDEMLDEMASSSISGNYKDPP